MPELAEVRIMSDFINHCGDNKIFKKIYYVDKGNIAVDSNLIEDFKVKANSNGKELKLKVYHDDADFNFSIFMGMSGNWTFVPTETWNDTKFVRMRIDTNDGYSLLLYGSYMGPKFKLGEFSGVKRGPDPVKNFNDFKQNIINNINSNDFNKSICEVLLNQKYFNGVGAYLNAEIVGRLDVNPFRIFKTLTKAELDNLFEMIYKCCNEAYEIGGGELIDWYNPFGKGSDINNWKKFYANKEMCYKQKFGKRNIWISKKWKVTQNDI